LNSGNTTLYLSTGDTPPVSIKHLGYSTGADMSICIVSCIALLHIITLSTTHDTRNRSTGAACRVLLRLRLVSYAYPRPEEGDLRERIPLLTSSSADGRDARSLSSLSCTSATPQQRKDHLPRAYSSPTLPSFQQEHLQVGLRISSFYVS
jgi:hypothetical protein